MRSSRVIRLPVEQFIQIQLMAKKKGLPMISILKEIVDVGLQSQKEKTPDTLDYFSGKHNVQESLIKSARL